MLIVWPSCRNKAIQKRHLYPFLWLSDYCNNGPQETGIFSGFPHWQQEMLKPGTSQGKLVSWREIPCRSDRSNHHLESEAEVGGIGRRYHFRPGLSDFTCLLPFINSKLHVRTLKTVLLGPLDLFVPVSNRAMLNKSPPFFSVNLSLWLIEDGWLSPAYLGCQSPGSYPNHSANSYVPKCT